MLVQKQLKTDWIEGEDNDIIGMNLIGKKIYNKSV